MQGRIVTALAATIALAVPTGTTPLGRILAGGSGSSPATRESGVGRVEVTRL